MLSVLFIGIAVMFLFLAIASYAVKLWIKRLHSEMIKVIEKEIERSEQGAKGWAPITAFLYKTVEWHFRFEIAGFLIAAFAAVVEFFLIAR